MSRAAFQRRVAVPLGVTLLSSLTLNLTSTVNAAADEMRRSATAESPLIEVVVSGDAPLSAAQVEAATGGAGRIVDTAAELGATRVEVPAGASAAAMTRIGRLGGVDDVTRDGRVQAFDTIPNDPYWADFQEPMRAVGAPKAWDTSTGSSTVVIAVIDSGVTPTPDLAGRLLPGIDLVNDDNDPSDDAGHGTDAALVAAAGGNDAVGTAGMCWQCRVLPIKVLDGDGSGSMYDVAEGIVYATNQGAKVINLSLGGPTNDPVVRSALDFAFAHDVVVVASAGNDGTDERNYPAAVPGVLSVTGTTVDTRRLYPWAQRGATWVDVAAPGCNWIADNEGLYRFCGTSSAAPLVAGMAGLLRSARPEATRDMVATALTGSADFSPTQGDVAYGIVDIARAVAAMPSVVAGPPPPPPDVTQPSVTIGVPDGFNSGVANVRLDIVEDQVIVSAALFVGGREVTRVERPDRLVDLAVDTAAFPDGDHLVWAVVRDAAGHEAASAGSIMTIDNANPVALLVSPTHLTTVRRPFPARVFVADPNGIMGTFLVANDRIVGGFTGAGWGEATVPVSRRGPIRVVAITVDQAGRISGSNSAVVSASVGRRRR